MLRVSFIVLAICAALAGARPASAAEADASAERGKQALVTQAFTPPAWSLGAYRNAWRRWGAGLREAPEPYDRAFQEYYGLHPAPYANGEYPMGLRVAPLLLTNGLTTDCLLCHGGAILGKSYVGLGNASLDIQALFEDLAAADGRRPDTPFPFGNVRGTTEAGGIAVWLLQYRQPDLSLRKTPLDLGVRHDLCEDAPAWWLLKKKKTMYHTGGGDARSVRSLMQFMLTPLNPASRFDKDETTFRDIQAYLLSIQPPRYPFPIDRALAKRGQLVFEATCVRCHGTYGPNGTYPNKIVALDVIGTDPKRFEGITKEFSAHYNRSWFAAERRGWLGDDYRARPPEGYQAPPLDGLWATAPYLHNGSVPTVYDVLNSRTRPTVFTRSYRTDREAYDADKLGWKVQVLGPGAGAGLPPHEQRKIYDTTQPGRGNGGHTFGDELSEAERLAVIEYLKTL